MILPCGCDNESEDALCYDARAMRVASQDAYKTYGEAIAARDPNANLYLDEYKRLQHNLYKHMGAI